MGIYIMSGLVPVRGRGSCEEGEEGGERKRETRVSEERVRKE